MHARTWLTTALAFSVALFAASAATACPTQSPDSTSAQSSSTSSGQVGDLRALDGAWIYVEDRTEGRALEHMGPPMSSKFSFRIEEDARSFA